MVWLGWSKLPGSWKASQPPGASQRTHDVSSSWWPGIHCSTALQVITSTGWSGRQVRMSASRNSSRPGWPAASPPPVPAAPASARAASIISGELSTPSTRAAGQRAARVAVRLPGPQPRSTTNPGCPAWTRLSRSKNGRPRSPPNRR